MIQEFGVVRFDQASSGIIAPPPEVASVLQEHLSEQAVAVITPDALTNGGGPLLSISRNGVQRSKRLGPRSVMIGQLNNEAFSELSSTIEGEEVESTSIGDFVQSNTGAMAFDESDSYFYDFVPEEIAEALMEHLSINAFVAEGEMGELTQDKNVTSLSGIMSFSAEGIFWVPSISKEINDLFLDALGEGASIETSAAIGEDRGD